MQTYIRYVIRHRWLVLAVFAAVTGFFLYHMAQISISSTPGEIFFGDNPNYLKYQARSAQFDPDLVATFGIETEGLLTEEVLERLQRLHEAIEAEPDAEIERVLSLPATQLIDSVDDELRVETVFEAIRNDPDHAAEIHRLLQSDALTRDFAISEDGQNTILMVLFTFKERGMETTVTAMDFLLGKIEEAGFDLERVHYAGMVPLLSEVVAISFDNVGFYLPITIAVLLLAVWLMFRRFWPVVVVGGITGIAVVWTMGLAVLLYGHINIITTTVPAMILITCFADVVHLTSAYLLELGAGRKKDEAIDRVGREVGTACGFTSITTFLGFASMMLVPAPIFRQTGLLMGFGVGCALFIALTLLPILFTIFREPKPWKTAETGGAVQGLLEHFLDWNARVVLRYPKLIVGLFALLVVAAIWGATSFKVETDIRERFAHDHPIQQGKRYFESTFPGAYPLDIYLETDRAGVLLEPENLRTLRRIQHEIEALPGVVRTLSPADLIAKLYRELAPEQAASADEEIPDTQQAIAQLLLLFDMSGGEDLDRLLDPDHTTLRVNARIEALGVIEIYQTGERIKRIVNEAFGHEVRAETWSMDYLMGEWLDEIVDGQKRGVVFAMITIAIMMIIAVGGVRNGLLSMIPNLLPLLVLIGALGLAWEHTDSDTLMAVIVAIGIGVDDTIHFLLRLKVESQKTDDVGKAVTATFHYAGRAIVITSIILVLGFSPFADSDYYSIWMFGALLPAVLVIALIADLFLLPAMLKLKWLKM